MEGYIFMAKGAAISARFGCKADGPGLFNPVFNQIHKFIAPGRILNCTEFGIIKNLGCTALPIPCSFFSYTVN